MKRMPRFGEAHRSRNWTGASEPRGGIEQPPVTLPRLALGHTKLSRGAEAAIASRSALSQSSSRHIATEAARESRSAMNNSALVAASELGIVGSDQEVERSLSIRERLADRVEVESVPAVGAEPRRFLRIALDVGPVLGHPLPVVEELRGEAVAGVPDRSEEVVRSVDLAALSAFRVRLL